MKHLREGLSKETEQLNQKRQEYHKVFHDHQQLVANLQLQVNEEWKAFQSTSEKDRNRICELEKENQPLRTLMGAP